MSAASQSDEHSRTLEDEIIRHAQELGFAVVGFVAPSDIPDTEQPLRDFVELDRHGDMSWLAKDVSKRSHPSRLWQDAKSIVVLGMRYTPTGDPMERLQSPELGNISVYALGSDYHDVIKKRLKRIGRWLSEAYNCELKVFVDTAPVMEKPIAQMAGLGWQGKHTNLVSPSDGSWLFLGSIFTTLDLAPSASQPDQCGSCQRCLDICPTEAFPTPYQLDARRCISYLTIEHKGHIPEEFRSAMGNRIYGCDDCLAVCPWNKFAQQAAEAALAPRTELVAPSLPELAELDDQSFRKLFSGSPVKRTGRDRFVRNVLIAIGNSRSKDLIPSAKALLDDPSPLVRAMAVWALAQLMETRDFAALRKRYAESENDPDVKAEWLRQNDSI